MGASPSKKSVKRLKQKVRDILRPGEKSAWPDVRDRLNDLLQGWSAYFCYGTTQIAYRAVERHVYNRVRRFLVSQHKVRSRGIYTTVSIGESIWRTWGALAETDETYRTTCALR